MRRWIQRLMVWAMCVGLLVAAPALAQEGRPISPAQLNVTAVRGETVSRTVIIQATEPLTNVRVVPQDLRLTEASGARVLPAESIRAQLSATTVAARDLLQVHLTFDLAAAPSGQFAGEVLIQHADGSFTVPVTVSVKDPPWMPLGLLVMGVVLGVGVSYYRQQGLPRDEVVVRLSQLRAQMQVDEELRDEGLGRPFLHRIGVHLAEADVALQGQRWTDAQAALTRAENVLQHWRSGRPDWQAQIEYYQTLMHRLEDLEHESSFYVGELQQAARDAYRSLPELDTPEAFHTKLGPLTAQLNEYLTLRSRIESVATLSGKYQGQARALTAKLNALKPHDAEGQRALENNIAQVLQAGRYAQVQPQLERLEHLISALDAEHAAAWEAKAQAFRAQMQETDADFLPLLTEIEAATQQVARLSGPTTRDAGMTFTVPKGGAVLESLPADAPTDALPQWLPTVPGISVQTLPDGLTATRGLGKWFAWLTDARWRIRLFTWITYGVAVAFLALSGFVELYGNRLDFGARGVADYFTLLAWGFGAEATRSAIADMVAGWGISSGSR